MIPLTALILTYNEKENIARTLAALSSVEHIVLIDSSSTDGTLEIAQRTRPDVRILPRAFDTHTQQWNFGLDQIKTEWVLTLDADYELSPEMQAEIARLEPPPEVVGYSADFEYRIFGHPLRASSYPPRVVLFRVADARYVDDGHTQLLKPNGQIEKLAGRIYHDDRKPLSHWIQAQDRYAILEALHLRSMPFEQLSFQDRLRRRIFFAAPAMFLYLLLGRGLILDLWPGWYYVFQRTLAEMLLSLRLITEREGLEAEGEKPEDGGQKPRKS
jgi:glycosyltransferase involved in cell wall biosynthesis